MFIVDVALARSRSRQLQQEAVESVLRREALRGRRQSRPEVAVGRWPRLTAARASLHALFAPSAVR